jgi:VWFA-related protein
MPLSGNLNAQAIAPQESEAPAPTLKLNVRTVLVDVVVTDKDGHAVPHLTKDEFQVLEDGKPQSISFFEPNFAPAVGTDAAVTPPPLPPGTFTNVPAVIPTDSVNILLMDALNTAEVDQSYVHKEMVQYLANLPPQMRLAVFMLSEKLRIIQGFTQDSTVLRAAIKRLAANPNMSPLLATVDSTNANSGAVNMIEEAAVENGYGGVPDATLSDMASALQQFQGQETGFEENERLVMTLDALQQIARYLRGIPGRKNLVWFVGVFPVCLPAMTSETALTNGGCPYQEKFRKTVAMLADARVSIYPVDARGLTTNTFYSAENPKINGAPTTFQGVISGQQASLNADLTQNTNNITGMDRIAKDTGGKPYYGGNDLKGALANDIENGARYYSLAYTPTDHKEIGRERTIEVKVPSGSYKLSYRRSYYEETPKGLAAEEAAAPTDPLRPLMDRGMPNFTELRYKVKLTPSAVAATAARAGDNPDLKGTQTRYTVGFSLATDGLVLTTGPDGVRRGQIEVALIAYSQDGKPLNWEARQVGLAIKPEQVALAEKSGIPFHFDIDAPAVDVYLRTGIYDLGTSRAGTLEIPLTAVVQR